MSTPNEIVAERITAELLKDNLISQDSARRLAGQLAKGEVKESHWLVLLREPLPSPKDREEKRQEVEE